MVEGIKLVDFLKIGSFWSFWGCFGALGTPTVTRKGVTPCRLPLSSKGIFVHFGALLGPWNSWADHIRDYPGILPLMFE